MSTIKKLITVVLILMLVAGNMRNVSYVFADDITPAPEQNTIIETTPAPEAPIVTQAPAPTSWIQKPEKPTKADKPSQPSDPIRADNISNDPESTLAPAQPLLINNTENNGGSTSGGNVGNTSIGTGDATSNGNIINDSNSNVASTGCSTCTTGNGGGATVVNSGNGTDSSNSGSANITGNNDTNQGNSANILNNSGQSATTGHNDSSKNVGNTDITTGDANATTTILTAANTNVDGVAVSQFNIADNHTGDYVLDFGASCISGCTNFGGVNVANVGNGAGSTNDGSINKIGNNNTNQTNDGTIINNANLSADSGYNQVDENTGGNATITTGDANTAANIINFLNNNIAGNVAYGVVNIFGNLIGDIIMPDNVFDQLACGSCGGNTNITNSGNGADSNNLGAVNNNNTNNTNQFNNADIANNVTLNGQTGNNSASKNTDGNNTITTGDINLAASVLNIANLNLAGGNMWLVFVNQAGNWIGQLFGADANGNMAGSPGVQFAVDPDGAINVINSGNGTESSNTGNVNSDTTNNLAQTNDAKIVNNVNLRSNTGNNSTDKNTGGDSSISTGNAQAIANIVNFVNNNITGGKLLVTFVNVFGSWKGDFLTPGSHKDSPAIASSNGSNNNNSNYSSNNNNNSSNNSGNSNTNTTLTNSINSNTVIAGGIINGRHGNKFNFGGVKVAKAEGSGNVSLLAGISKDVKSSNNTRTINLAWAFLALPVVAFAIIYKKRSRTA